MLGAIELEKLTLGGTIFWGKWYTTYCSIYKWYPSCKGKSWPNGPFKKYGPYYRGTLYLYIRSHNLKKWHLGVPFSGASGILHIVLYINGILHAKGKVGPMDCLKNMALHIGVPFTRVIGHIT